MIEFDNATVYSDSKVTRALIVSAALIILVTGLGIAGIGIIFRGPDWAGSIDD